METIVATSQIKQQRNREGTILSNIAYKDGRQKW